MARLKENVLPPIPPTLFDMSPNNIKLLHINIGHIQSKIHDMAADELFESPHIISFNETHDTLTTQMLGLAEDFSIFCKDRNASGGGVALIVHNSMQPQEIEIEVPIELVAIKVCNPLDMTIISVYRPPSSHMCEFVN